METVPHQSRGPDNFVELVRLKARYCRYVDLKQWDELAELFVPHARFDGFGSAPPGADLQKFIAGVSERLSEAVSVHHCHMPDIVFLSADRARGVWAMEDYVQWPAGTRVREASTASGFKGYGFYEDEYSLTELGWKISFSRLTRLRLDPIEEAKEPIARGWSSPNKDWLRFQKGPDF